MKDFQVQVRLRFSETDREINKDIVVPKNFHRFLIPLLGEIVRKFELLFAASNANSIIAAVFILCNGNL